jgi:hypothetical protein
LESPVLGMALSASASPLFVDSQGPDDTITLSVDYDGYLPYFRRMCCLCHSFAPFALVQDERRHNDGTKSTHLSGLVLRLANIYGQIPL